jgi:hypothetical protein
MAPLNPIRGAPGQSLRGSTEVIGDVQPSVEDTISAPSLVPVSYPPPQPPVLPSLQSNPDIQTSNESGGNAGFVSNMSTPRHIPETQLQRIVRSWDSGKIQVKVAGEISRKNPNTILRIINGTISPESRYIAALSEEIPSDGVFDPVQHAFRMKLWTLSGSTNPPLHEFQFNSFLYKQAFLWFPGSNQLRLHSPDSFSSGRRPFTFQFSEWILDSDLYRSIHVSYNNSRPELKFGGPYAVSHDGRAIIYEEGDIIKSLSLENAGSDLQNSSHLDISISSVPK